MISIFLSLKIGFSLANSEAEKAAFRGATGLSAVCECGIS